MGKGHGDDRGHPRQPAPCTLGAPAWGAAAPWLLSRPRSCERGVWSPWLQQPPSPAYPPQGEALGLTTMIWAPGEPLVAVATQERKPRFHTSLVRGEAGCRLLRRAELGPAPAWGAVAGEGCSQEPRSQGWHSVRGAPVPSLRGCSWLRVVGCICEYARV